MWNSCLYYSSEYHYIIAINDLLVHNPQSQPTYTGMSIALNRLEYVQYSAHVFKEIKCTHKSKNIRLYTYIVLCTNLSAAINVGVACNHVASPE